MAEKKKWEDMTRKEKATGLITLGVIALILIVIFSGGDKKNANNTASTTNTPAATQSATATKPATPQTTASRQIKGTATTLGAGSFTGGKDVAVGLYDVTPGAGQSGNFSVSGTDEYNEILGGDSSTGGVPKVRVQISNGDKIDISGLSSVAFTPVTAPFVTSYAPATLYAGTFTVGEDIGAGRYTVTPGSGQSGNFSVSGNDEYNEILGTDTSMGDVPSVKVTLTKGDVIAISGLSQVNFAPSN